MGDEARSPLHVELRESRERKGITLEAIYAATRINSYFLKGIERGDFDFLPRTYVRLFLRAYATQVGMDPQYVLDRYEELKRPVLEEAISPLLAQQRPLSWGAVIALVAGLVLLGWAGVMMFKNRIGNRYPTASWGGLPSPPASVQKAPVRKTPQGLRLSGSDRGPQAVMADTLSSPAVPERQAGLPDTASVRSISDVAWPDRDSVAVLQGVCVEQTWLDIWADGQRVFRGTMNSGDERTWTARKGFYVVAGRSRGVRFSLQEKPLPPVKARASEVLRWSINRDKITLDRRPHLTAGSEDILSPRPALDKNPKGALSADSIGRE